MSEGARVAPVQGAEAAVGVIRAGEVDGESGGRRTHRQGERAHATRGVSRNKNYIWEIYRNCSFSFLSLSSLLFLLLRTLQIAITTATDMTAAMAIFH